MDRAALKELAKNQIRGNIGILFLCMLVVTIINVAAGAITGGIGMIFVAAPMNISMCMIYINLAKGQKPTVANTFDGFDVFGKSLWLSIITSFFMFLWSLLFIIPGIVKSFSYAMAPYILAENHNMTAREALSESKRIMDGHKGELFVSHLSFIPWLMLGSITGGIAMIYVTPYMNMTITNFYNNIKNQPTIV